MSQLCYLPEKWMLHKQNIGIEMNVWNTSIDTKSLTNIKFQVLKITKTRPLVDFSLYLVSLGPQNSMIKG